MSKEKKFTPGPWRTHDNNSELVCCVKNKYHIANTDIDDDVTREEAKANSTLIAVSPELIEALEIANKLLFHKVNWEDEEERLAMNNIKSVINKAYGE